MFLFIYKFAIYFGSFEITFFFFFLHFLFFFFPTKIKGKIRKGDEGSGPLEPTNRLC